MSVARSPVPFRWNLVTPDELGSLLAGTSTPDRLLAFAAPVGGVAAMVAFGFAGFMDDSSRHWPSSVMLLPALWAILGATPVLAFVLAVLVVNRWERSTY